MVVDSLWCFSAFGLWGAPFGAFGLKMKTFEPKLEFKYRMQVSFIK